MEVHTERKCSAVYLCTGLEDDICELFYTKSPPKELLDNSPLSLVYQNVHVLLDEDQGGLDEGKSWRRCFRCRVG